MRRRLGSAAAVLLFVTVAAGCGGAAADRQSLVTAGMLPPLRATEPVAIVAGRSTPSSRSIPIVGTDVSIDYDSVATAAVARLQHELQQLGVPTAPDASRRIELTVMYVDLLIQSAGAATACIIDFRATLGDGSVRGLQGREKSGDYEAACDAATTNMTVATLNDPVVQRYITAPAADPP